MQRGVILDATRIADDTVVTLKKIKTSLHPYEIDICRYFSSEPRASDPANRCVPVYEVLDVPDDPDYKLIVMPFLRKFYDPRFLTVGEAVEFFRQAFEVRDASLQPSSVLSLTRLVQGLRFMHAHHVAHR